MSLKGGEKVDGFCGSCGTELNANGCPSCNIKEQEKATEQVKKNKAASTDARNADDAKKK
jgi:hypothetical protein